METQPMNQPSVSASDMTPLALTERHLHEWLQLLDYLQDAHAPTNQQTYCRNQVTRLQLDLYKLRNQ
ncbi:hypothetical protein HNV11_17860 [Spirosoma taeanense]|uniref:Uncharacterized protein n=1 Tax=Spirosoma taeanense TaxID=2735870 RepID=A0A6M5YAW2_9BACT|nr:hypothetical protein [Spirosoma taeanense]QJW91109.1 hypothetical protein HNV11_17860 [Spirosoma taeanense]